MNALMATTAIAGLCFLTSIFSDQTVYLWLLNTTGMGGFILWLAIAVSHYRFRRGYVRSGGRVDELPYAAGLFPWGSVFAFAVCFVIMLGQNYQAFLGETPDWAGFFACYIGLFIFLALWIGARIKTGCRFVRYSEMTFHAGGHPLDE